jgi:thioesterase domain-containing protein
MHAGAGTVLFYNSLSYHLGNDQPMYGLQAKGLNGNEAPHTRIEDMAAHYISEIRLIQPEGPYFLAGYCLGGILAFEMAQQLTRQGEKIALLASLNGVSPTYVNKSVFVETYYISRNQALPELLGKYYFLETNTDMVTAYKPLTYTGKMVILRSAEIYHEPHLGWDKYVLGSIETRDIPGKHANRRQIMNEPFVRYTAEELQKYLSP